MSRIHALVAGALLSASLVSTASANGVVLGPAPGVYTFQGLCTDCFGTPGGPPGGPIVIAPAVVGGTPAQATLTMGSNTGSYADDVFSFTSNNFPGGVTSTSIQSIVFGPINASGFADVRIEFLSNGFPVIPIFTVSTPGASPLNLLTVPAVVPVSSFPWFFETSVTGQWALGGLFVGGPPNFDFGVEGKWTAPAQVPLPGTLALIGLACAGFGMHRLRRTAAAPV